jgi:hypothetical protein
MLSRVQNRTVSACNVAESEKLIDILGMSSLDRAVRKPDLVPFAAFQKAHDLDGNERLGGELVCNIVRGPDELPGNAERFFRRVLIQVLRC